MAHLINKDAVVAEIEKRIKEIDEIGTYLSPKGVLTNLLCRLDTLEVKEVDLEKEIDNFYGMYRKNGKTYLIEDNEECVDWKVDCNPNFEKAFAKHFFELGLKAQKEK